MTSGSSQSYSLSCRGADDSPLQLAGSRLSLSPGLSSGSPDNTKLSLPGLCGPDKELKADPPASGELPELSRDWPGADAWQGQRGGNGATPGREPGAVTRTRVNCVAGDSRHRHLSDQSRHRPTRADVTLIKRPRRCRVTGAGFQALMAPVVSVPRTPHNAALSLLVQEDETRAGMEREGNGEKVGRTQQVRGSKSSQDSPGFIITSDNDSPTF